MHWCLASTALRNCLRGESRCFRTKTRRTFLKKTILRPGFKIGPKKALTARQVWEIRFDLQHRGLHRERALFDLAIASKLSGCDLVRLRVDDVSAGFEIKRRGMIIQQKTGNPVQLEITETTHESLTAWLAKRDGQPEDYLFPSRLARCPHLGTRQYGRLVRDWVTAIGLRPEE